MRMCTLILGALLAGLGAVSGPAFAQAPAQPINAGPVHVSDFILAYAKDKKAWRYRPQLRVREGIDPAYSTWLDDPSAPHAPNSDHRSLTAWAASRYFLSPVRR